MKSGIKSKAYKPFIWLTWYEVLAVSFAVWVSGIILHWTTLGTSIAVAGLALAVFAFADAFYGGLEGYRNNKTPSIASRVIACTLTVVIAVLFHIVYSFVKDIIA